MQNIAGALAFTAFYALVFKVSWTVSKELSLATKDWPLALRAPIAASLFAVAALIIIASGYLSVGAVLTLQFKYVSFAASIIPVSIGGAVLFNIYPSFDFAYNVFYHIAGLQKPDDRRIPERIQLQEFLKTVMNVVEFLPTKQLVGLFALTVDATEEVVEQTEFAALQDVVTKQKCVDTFKPSIFVDSGAKPGVNDARQTLLEHH